MNSFDYLDTLWGIFTQDEVLLKLLEADPRDEGSLHWKFRREDRQFEDYEAEGLDFITMWFAEAERTRNHFMNHGLLRFDIYCTTRDNAGLIRQRIVELMHINFDERVKFEGQWASGVASVYKYRMEFTPLIFT